jgi:hypothetical protein
VIDRSFKLVHCRKFRALGRVARSQDVSVCLPPNTLAELQRDMARRRADLCNKTDDNNKIVT